MFFDAGLIGLAISYSLAVTSLLSGVVNAFTETEKEMIAVERACQYIEEVESEKTQAVLSPPYAWPSQGVVTFNNVVLKYRSVLSFISLLDLVSVLVLPFWSLTMTMQGMRQ
jgi:ATP-binding cassette subfamily C (CFTR/MRP) protein 10